MLVVMTNVGAILPALGTREQATLFSCLFLFSEIFLKLTLAKLPLTETRHFSLAQHRVKNAQTLTVKPVKGMMKKKWNFNSEVTTC